MPTLIAKLREITFAPPVAYAAGITIQNTADDLLRTFERNGVIYAVRPTSAPYVTTGTWTGSDEDNVYVVQQVGVPINGSNVSLLVDGNTVNLESYLDDNITLYQAAALNVLSSITGSTNLLGFGADNAEGLVTVQQILNLFTVQPGSTATDFDPTNHALSFFDENNAIQEISLANFFKTQASQASANLRLVTVNEDNARQPVTIPLSAVGLSGSLTPLVNPSSVRYTFPARDVWDRTPILPNGVANAWNLVQIDGPEASSNTTFYYRNAGSTLDVTGTEATDAALVMARTTGGSIGSLIAKPVLLDADGRFDIRTDRENEFVDFTVLGVYG